MPGAGVPRPAPTIESERVTRVLERMREEAAERDPPARARVAAREAQLGHRVYGREAVELYGDAHLSITPEVGRLLYVLARAVRARTIVEFGTSFGLSTIHLAAAVRDGGEGAVITTELSAEKAARARLNLEEAGLAEHVDVRAGDARVTLAGLAERVELLFLDGWNDLYLELLALLEGNLAAGALVVADMTGGDPHDERYRARMFGAGREYLSVELPLDAGVVVSLRTASRGS